MVEALFVSATTLFVSGLSMVPVVLSSLDQLVSEIAPAKSVELRMPVPSSFLFSAVQLFKVIATGGDRKLFLVVENGSLPATTLEWVIAYGSVWCEVLSIGVRGILVNPIEVDDSAYFPVQILPFKHEINVS